MDVSIIIAYNVKRKDYLKAAIRSAEGQQFSGSFEVIVQQGDYVVSKNINDAIKRARGRYIKLLGEDDLLTNDCLETLYGRDLVCADAINWSDDGHCDYSRSDPGADIFKKNAIHGGTVMYARVLLEEYRFDESLWTGEEYDLHLRIVRDGYKFHYIPKVVYLYRVHLGQKSSRDLLLRYKEIERIKNKYNGY